MTLALILAAALAASPASAKPAPCAARLASVEQERALVQVKLEEETERADAQTYLTRLELAVTKQKLAAALAKCGAACAAPTPPAR